MRRAPAVFSVQRRRLPSLKGVAFRVGKDDEVPVCRATVPVHALGTESGEPRRLGFLLGRILRVQVKVQLRVVLGRRLASL